MKSIVTSEEGVEIYYKVKKFIDELNIVGD